MNASEKDLAENTSIYEAMVAEYLGMQHKDQPATDRDIQQKDTEYTPIAQWKHVHGQCQPDDAKVPYKRRTHFLAHLNQLTGRNGITRLPKGLLAKIKRSRVDVTNPMAYHRIRRLMKKWGYSSTEYRHIFAVLRYRGGPVLTLTYQQERAIRQDFEELCDLFDRRRPLGYERKAMMSYYLCIQFLLKKYHIYSYYVLPSIKDTAKFERLVQAYSDLLYWLCPAFFASSTLSYHSLRLAHTLSKTGLCFG